MKTYTVGILFECQADDEDHAVEQFLDSMKVGRALPPYAVAQHIEAHVNYMEES